LTPGVNIVRGGFAAGLLMLWLGGMAFATTPQEQGLAVVMEADRRGQGFRDTASTMQMTLRNKRGEQTIRRLRSRTLEQADDGDRSLIIFDDPRDIRGTALLTFTHKQGPDDQWLYLPALKRVKRIASSNRSGPFVGSEFAYEDLGSQEVEKYDYRLVGEEMFDDRAHFVIERRPRDSKSGYTRHVIWVDQEEYRTFKVDYYDRKGSLLKTLNAGEYQQYLGRYWRPGRMEMVNHQTGKSTTLIWSDYTFRNGFTERDFSRSSLADTR
jgi:outer membrane lipoprotein-sorting protein